MLKKGKEVFFCNEILSNEIVGHGGASGEIKLINLDGTPYVNKNEIIYSISIDENNEKFILKNGLVNTDKDGKIKICLTQVELSRKKILTVRVAIKSSDIKLVEILGIIQGENIIFIQKKFGTIVEKQVESKMVNEKLRLKNISGLPMQEGTYVTVIFDNDNDNEDNKQVKIDKNSEISIKSDQIPGTNVMIKLEVEGYESVNIRGTVGCNLGNIVFKKKEIILIAIRAYGEIKLINKDNTAYFSNKPILYIVNEEEIDGFTFLKSGFLNADKNGVISIFVDKLNFKTVKVRLFLFDTYPIEVLGIVRDNKIIFIQMSKGIVVSEKIKI